MEREFIIRSYGRMELAQLYCPHVTGHHAYRKLRSWMTINPQLQPLCRQTKRSYTPAEVQLIVSVLGEP